MLSRLTHILETVQSVPTVPQLATLAIRKMATNGASEHGLNGTKFPADWHSGPDDSFHGKITADGPFQPEKDRYHLYIGLFCPFAHRANLVRKLKQLDKYAGIDISIVKPYPKDEPGTPGKPGWRFNHKNEGEPYEGATEDKLFGYRFMNEVYFRADKSYKGRYSVPVLWDMKLNTIVNNESAELLRDLQTAFNELLPASVAEMNLYPKELQGDIDTIAGWMGDHLNTGVYKAGFAPDQATYDKNLPPVFAALNKLERIAKEHGGPYILGENMTELDVRAYATICRFDPVYVQHFKCNLGMIRYSYPVLHNWLKGLYFNHQEYRNTTDFRHIKENYTKSHYDVNPKSITPMDPGRMLRRDMRRIGAKSRQGALICPTYWRRRRNSDEFMACSAWLAAARRYSRPADGQHLLLQPCHAPAATSTKHTAYAELTTPVARIATAIEMAPKKQSKVHALITKAKARFAAKKRENTLAQQASDLIFVAHSIDDQIQKAIVEAQNLVVSARDNPRPTDPPPRDPLFSPPKDAPLSGSERRRLAYNAVVDRYRSVQDNMRVLQERVASFQENVKKLKGLHVPAKKMRKVDHDVEALENACGNMDVAMLKLAAEIGGAKRAAT
ncbi:hypothetical protein LTR17_013016 [Elasticomyces elasticus]|nr:hypothetical protein LTR17_013016 [Elasticomyces elasticus]